MENKITVQDSNKKIKLEYDTSMGGDVKVDTTISTNDYAANVLTEMKHLLNDAQGPQNKLIFQTLPINMRRRAMSHHPNRLPRKYREAHCAQMAKAGAFAPNKRPSRKYRRRSSNYMRYFGKTKLQRRLQTHIWHAKRFSMIQRWGYYLPYAARMKNYRSCYRALKEKCLLQDVSYLRQIQIRGHINCIREAFYSLTDPNCLPVTAPYYVRGHNEGRSVLYRFRTWPYQAIQCVYFMWCPDKMDNGNTSTMWLWVHPSTYELVREELHKAFIYQFDDVVAKTSKGEIYMNDLGTVELQDMTGYFNRFRLSGPLSQQILKKVLVPAKVSFETFDFNWFEQNYRSTRAHVDLKIQETFWNAVLTQLNHPAHVSNNLIVSLAVDDPRIHYSSKSDTNDQHQVDSYSMLKDLSKYLLSLPRSSALWKQEYCEQFNANKMSTSEYENLRAAHVAVPGSTDLNFERSLLQPVPLLLIQRPGNFNENVQLGFGAGWDVIFPADYAMIFWIALIVHGAQIGGLRETTTLHSKICVEEHLPDTASGLMEAEDTSKLMREQYFRKPPSKRVNYRKLCVKSPFEAPFAYLVNDWLDPSYRILHTLPQKHDFYVLRDPKMLELIRGVLCDENPQSGYKEREELEEKSIVQVTVTMCGEGKIHNFAMICLPTELDISTFKRHPKTNIVEELVADSNSSKRKKLQENQKKLLKRLKARRVREKRKLQKNSNTRVKISPANTAKICADYEETINKLWLPNAPFPKVDKYDKGEYRDQCSREVFGYITKGGFNFLRGVSDGVGYVTIMGLQSYIQESWQRTFKKKLVLIRNPDSCCYHFATIQINNVLHTI